MWKVKVKHHRINLFTTTPSQASEASEASEATSLVVLQSGPPFRDLGDSHRDSLHDRGNVFGVAQQD